MECMKRLILLAGLLACAGCVSNYAPSVQVLGAAYQTDLAACQEQSSEALDKRAAKTGLAWFSSPFRFPFQVRPAIRACLQGKGYTLAG